MKKLIFFLFTASMSIAVSAADNLTFEALQKGHASGAVIGQEAENIRSKTLSKSPITMSVKVLHRYAQSGCGRLDYIVRQADVKAKDGSLQKLELQWQMNICQDGSPPETPMIIIK